MTDTLSKKIKFNGRAITAEWCLRKYQLRLKRKPDWLRHLFLRHVKDRKVDIL